MMKGAQNTQLCPVAVGSEHSPNAKGFFVCGFWFYFFCGHHVDMIVFLNVLVNAQANQLVRKQKKKGGRGRMREKGSWLPSLLAYLLVCRTPVLAMHAITKFC